MRGADRHLHVLLQLDLDCVVLLAVPDPLLAELLLVVLHLLHAVDEVLQLRTADNRVSGPPDQLSPREPRALLDGSQRPTLQGFEFWEP